MGRFNSPATSVSTQRRTTNLAGGEAFVQTPETNVVTLILNSMVQDQFYRSADDTMEQVYKAAEAFPLLNAQAAVYARHVYGLRSISHLVAVAVAPHTFEGKRDFYNAVIRRPDDITEILSLYHAKNGAKAPLPSAMKAGLSRAMGRFDRYQIAKWRGEGRGWKLIDAVRALHPKPTDRNGTALTDLVKGELRVDATAQWEAGLSAAKTPEEKAKVWRDLLHDNRLGYMALLKNLRNILQTNDDPAILWATERLVNEEAIRRSLVLPFRFVSAYYELVKQPGGKYNKLILEALEAAMDISIANVPEFPGRTLVVLDTSGSMGTLSPHAYNPKEPIAKAAPLAAALVYRGADLITFHDEAMWLTTSPRTSVMGIIREIAARAKTGGTNFHAPFALLEKSGQSIPVGEARSPDSYDRMIWLSDMQGWVVGTRLFSLRGSDTNLPTADLAKYEQRTGVRPFIHSLDLAGYGAGIQFPEERILAMAGFSNRVFDVMSVAESHKSAMLDGIRKVNFSDYTGRRGPVVEETETEAESE